MNKTPDSPKRLKLKCLGCDALARPIYWCAAQTPQIVDVELFPLGLHAQPADLRGRLQARIDAAAAQQYDAVVMAYGLCGKATAGLVARDLPLVIPRAHDCITLFLGSRQRYQEQFEHCPGTYWYARDYLERNTLSGAAAALGAETTDPSAVYDEYVAKYGRDNADYLMEVMGAWQQHYQRAGFLDVQIGDSAHIEHQARAEAERRGWRFERLAGDLGLIRRLLEAQWDADFLVLQPGQQLTMTSDADILGCGVPTT
jgi:hypothetical protein